VRCPYPRLLLRVLLIGTLVWAVLAALPLATVAAAEPPTTAARQGFDLLLDRFVSPLEPADLAHAAAAAVQGQVPEERHSSLALPEFEGDRERVWGLFATWLDRAVELSAPDVERPALEEAALVGMAGSVNESHTRYMSHRQFQDHRAWTRGDVRYAGIGARMRGPTPVVVEVFEESPAARAGLRPGDTIVAVDGVPTEGTPLEASITRIRGPEGSPVTLQVRRPEIADVLEFVLTREEIKLAFVRFRVLDDNVGLLQLRGFSAPTVADEFLGALDRLDEAGIEGLVIDLRGNGGGRIDIGVRLASRFVAEGPLFEQSGRSRNARVVDRSGEVWARPVPLAILVDGGTASMGEIFTQALREKAGARVIGTKTAGSVAAAQVFPLVDGSALQVTVLQIVSAGGVKLNTVGLMPDQVVDVTDDEIRRGEDPQLKAAVNYLRDARRRGHSVRQIGSRVAPVLRAA
jgi:carboxyl-terminal processing protease